MAVKVKLHLYYSGMVICNIGDILLGVGGCGREPSTSLGMTRRGFGVMVCNIGDILLGVVVWGGMKEGSHPERRWWNKAEPS